MSNEFEYQSYTELLSWMICRIDQCLQMNDINKDTLNALFEKVKKMQNDANYDQFVSNSTQLFKELYEIRDKLDSMLYPSIVGTDAWMNLLYMEASPSQLAK